MRKRPKPNKNRKYTFDEMVTAAQEMSRKNMAKNLLDCGTFILEVCAMVLADDFDFTAEQLHNFERLIYKYINDFKEDEFSTYDMQAKYKELFKDFPVNKIRSGG